VALSSNFYNTRLVDSSRMALLQALKYPDRMSELSRYRLEAEAAYSIRYDLVDAVRWTNLYLKQDPNSSSEHSELGVYLFSLGRAEDAVREFTRAVELGPRGEVAPIPLFNQAVALLATGQFDDVRGVRAKLEGSFGDGIELLTLDATGAWSAAESLSTRLLDAPDTPSWLRTLSLTSQAGSLAARGAVAASDRVLRQAVADREDPGPLWYTQARLLQGVIGARRMEAPSPAILGDTSAGGLITAGLWAALIGDSLTARLRLAQLAGRGPVELRRFAGGVALVRARMAATSGRWADVVEALSPVAARGEYDGADPGQVSSLALRWTLADAYERLGRLDSAAAYFALLRSPSMPFGHQPLRGFVCPLAERRLVLLQQRLGQR
jgi:tetratricopeptide (TPR) repeat protein